jgi:hypothetical protein
MPFRPWQPGQANLLPPSAFDWLSAYHQVYFLLERVDASSRGCRPLPN